MTTESCAPVHIRQRPANPRGEKRRVSQGVILTEVTARGAELQLKRSCKSNATPMLDLSSVALAAAASVFFHAVAKGCTPIILGVRELQIRNKACFLKPARRVMRSTQFPVGEPMNRNSPGTFETRPGAFHLLCALHRDQNRYSTPYLQKEQR